MISLFFFYRLEFLPDICSLKLSYRPFWNKENRICTISERNSFYFYRFLEFNSDNIQIVTIQECSTYGSHTARNRYRCQTTIFVERAIAYGSHRIRDNCIHTSLNQRITFCSDNGVTVIAGIIYGVTVLYCYRSQGTATTESTHVFA